MIKLFKTFSVIVCEYLGWLTIVDKRKILHYLDSHKIIGTCKTPLISEDLFCLSSIKVKHKIYKVPRLYRVLVSLLISMTVGAIMLIALSHTRLSGVFILFSVQKKIERALQSDVPQVPALWNRIEVFYSNTDRGNIAYLTAYLRQLKGLQWPEGINCHFVVCNGREGREGEIQTTKRWQSQWSAIPCETWHGGATTIRICVVALSDGTFTTNLQKRLVHALIKELCKRFGIPDESVSYPKNWQ